MNWISVEHDLPCHSGLFLVFGESIGVVSSWFVEGVTEQDVYPWDYYDVTHWMDLPAPPRKDQK